MVGFPTYMPDFGARFDPAGPIGPTGGILGGGQPGGVLGGGGFSQLLDPQVALPIASALIGGRNLQQSLAGATQVAGQVIPDMRRRAALNAWIKAKSKGGTIDPETMQLLQSYPDLAGSMATSMLTPDTKQLQFSPTGEGYIFGTKTGSLTPIGGGFAGPSNLPMVGTTDQGTPDAGQQEQFLTGLNNPGVAGLIKGIANYELDPSKVLPQRGGQREQVMALVRQYDPTYDMTQYGARAAMRKSITSGTYSQALNSANLVIQHLDALQKAYEGLNNTRFPTWNAISNTFGTETGNQKLQAAKGSFDTAADAVASELAKVFKGTGSTAEQEIREWRANVGSSMSPAAFHAAVQTLVGDLLKSRLDTIRSQFQSAMGKPAAFTMLTPHSKQVLTQIGIDPAALDNPSGASVSQPAASAPPAAAPPDPLGIR